MCHTQNSATYLQGQAHNFDSNIVRSCYTKNLVSGPYLLQRLLKFIITSHGFTTTMKMSCKTYIH